MSNLKQLMDEKISENLTDLSSTASPIVPQETRNSATVSTTSSSSSTEISVINPINPIRGNEISLNPEPMSMKSAFDAIVRIMVNHQRKAFVVENVIEPIMLCMLDYEIEMELRANLKIYSSEESQEKSIMNNPSIIALLEAVGNDHTALKRRKREDIFSLLSQGNVDYRKWATNARYEQLAESNVGRIRPAESSNTIFCVGDIDWEVELGTGDGENTVGGETKFFRYIEEIATVENAWKTKVDKCNKTVDLAFNLGEDGLRKFVGSEAFAASLEGIQKTFDTFNFDVVIDWPPASFDNHLMEYMKPFKLKGSPLKRYLVKEDSVLPPRYLTFIKGQIVKLSKNRRGPGGVLQYNKLPKKFIDNYDKLIEIKPEILLLPDPSFLRLVYIPKEHRKKDLNPLFNVSFSSDTDTKHMGIEVEVSTSFFKPKEYGLMFTTEFVHPFSGFVMSAEEAIPEKRRLSLWPKLATLKDEALRNLASQEWSQIWQNLEEIGWTKQQSDLNFPVFIPGFTAVDNNIPGETSFIAEDEVRQYLLSGY